MTKIEIKSSPLKYIVSLIAAIGFVVAGVIILLIDGPKWIGWSNIIFFGAGIPLFIWQILDKRPRLKIDDSGIIDRTIGVGKIAWEDIEGAFIKSVGSNDFICLNLKDNEKYINRLTAVRKAMTKANEKLGFTPVLLNLSGAGVNSHELLELIIKTIETKRNQSG